MGAEAEGEATRAPISKGAYKALQRIVPWAEKENENDTKPSGTVRQEAELLPVTLPLRPAWAGVGGFPADLAELLESCGLEHRATCFGDEDDIVSLVLRLVELGPAEFVQRLCELGVAKVGERQRLLGGLTRATHQLQLTAASIVDKALEARLGGLAGRNLLAFVSTFPKAEKEHEGSISIAGVVEAMSITRSLHAASVAALSETLQRQWLGWLSEPQLNLLRTLAVFVLVCVLDSGLAESRSLEALSAHRRLCEAAGLLPLSSSHAPWHRKPLVGGAAGVGGALLILSEPRQHLWQELPSTLGVVPAVMGGRLPDATIDACNASARRTLTRGEIGILHSNAVAWQRALSAGWEWALVLEDDAHFGQNSKCGASLLMFLARLPAIIAAATEHMPDWQIICLSPVNWPYDFFGGTPAEVIPHIISSPNLIRQPELLPTPTPRGSEQLQLPPCWQRCPPTYHAFAWVYRAPLMAALVEGFSKRTPALEPLDIWVWELMAQNGVLHQAICPSKALVDRWDVLYSIKDQQDEPNFLKRVYGERGYGAAVSRRQCAANEARVRSPGPATQLEI